MKILHYFKLILTLVFALLFYKQSPGLNTLIFSSLLIISLICLKNKQSKHPFAVYLLLLLSAASVFLYGNSLSLFSFFILFIVLSGQMAFLNAPMAFAMMPGLINTISAFPYQVVKFMGKKTQAGKGQISSDRIFFKLLKLLLIMLVVFVFFMLYLHASAGFSRLVNTVDFKFPNIYFWLILLLGAFCTHAILHHAGKSILRYLMPKSSEHIDPKKYLEHPTSSSWISIGTSLFIALNILSIVVLVSDLSFVLSGTLGNQNPSFYSEIVHEGVWSLIISVLLAMALLFIFFEGRINFIPGKQRIKRLAYAWIICNIFLILLTFYKNGLYIQELGMTYKRIGVWYYLLASVIGLIILYLKIARDKNILYAIRKTVPIYLFILVISSFMPWEIAVTNYNLAEAEKKGIAADLDYLMHLDGNNLHLLKAYVERSQTNSINFYDTSALNHRIIAYQKNIPEKDFRSLVWIENLSLEHLKP